MGALGGDEVAAKWEPPLLDIQPRWLSEMATRDGCQQVLEITGFMTWVAALTATHPRPAVRAATQVLVRQLARNISRSPRLVGARVGVGRSPDGRIRHSRQGHLWAAHASVRHRLQGGRGPRSGGVPRSGTQCAFCEPTSQRRPEGDRYNGVRPCRFLRRGRSGDGRGSGERAAFLRSRWRTLPGGPDLREFRNQRAKSKSRGNPRP